MQDEEWEDRDSLKKKLKYKLSAQKDATNTVNLFITYYVHQGRDHWVAL